VVEYLENRTKQLESRKKIKKKININNIKPIFFKPQQPNLLFSQKKNTTESSSPPSPGSFTTILRINTKNNPSTITRKENCLLIFENSHEYNCQKSGKTFFSKFIPV
jgi:hypothetical protein